jgi:menaquinone-9 beta-reductase
LALSFGRPNVDAVVVGAGPAGSVAALVLAQAGVRVRLIDRATFPRDKLCGDTLNPGSLSILDRLSRGGSLDPPGSLADLIRARSLPISGMTVTGPGARVSADYPDGLSGASLTRRHLDQILVDTATSAGVCFEPDVSVTGPLIEDERVVGVRLASRQPNCSLRARIVIAADGRGSRVAAGVKLSSYARQPRRWAFGAYFTGVTQMTPRGEMHIRPDGYIGIAPLPDGLTNVSVVRDERRGLRATRAEQQALVRCAVASNPELRDRFDTATQVSPVTVLGPLAVDALGAGCPGLLLAGDAAGFVDPMTGDGLRFALRGGELAAQAALSELASGRPAFRSLDAMRTREFSTKWRVNRALRLIVGSPRALDLAAIISKRWASPVEYLIGVAGDVQLARRPKAERL